MTLSTKKISQSLSYPALFGVSHEVATDGPDTPGNDLDSVDG